MRKKIQDIIEGRFEEDETRLILPESQLNFTVVEQEVYTGSFRIKSSTGKPVRGIAECCNPSIRCLDTTFNAPEAVIRFTCSTIGLNEGDEIRGEFVLLCDVGEYLLPFTARISRHYLPSSIGKIKSLNDFTNLCQLNWEEALTIFTSPYFLNIFHEDAGYAALLYDGLNCRRGQSHELEEFLIGCGKKKRNTFRVEDERLRYEIGEKHGKTLPCMRYTEGGDKEKGTLLQGDYAGGGITDTLVISKSEWGHISIRLRSDSSFIRLSKTRVQMYDFIGKHAQIPFEILPQRMHAGKNFAVITLESFSQTRRVVIEAGRIREMPRSIHSFKRRLNAQLERKYLDYKSGILTGTAWMEASIPLLKKGCQQDPDNYWNHLFAAYIYLKNNKNKEAAAALLKVPRNMRTQDTPLSVFYLFLATWTEEPEGRREVTVRVREYLLKYPGHPVMCWLLLENDEALIRNPERKYSMLRRFCTAHSTSPVFYQEAAQLVLEYPRLLQKLDVFERRLIYWLARKNLLTPVLARRILEFAPDARSFDANFYRTLGRCYKLLPEESTVRTICVYLIRLSRYGESYFPWFARGVELHLRLAGLYEAYMLSWSRTNGELPEEVLRYFSRRSTLPARRKTMLFAYVVRNKKRLGEDWDAYMDMVREFAASELARGEMSEDLSIICEEIRRQNPEEWQAIRGSAEETWRITVSSGRASRLQLLQLGMERQRKVVIRESAYVTLTTVPYVVLYEDADGTLFSARGSFRLRRMMSGGELSPLKGHHENRSAQTKRTAPKGRSKELLHGSVESMYDAICESVRSGSGALKPMEELMVRMLFTGNFIPAHEEIYKGIALDPDARELRSAYAVWFSRSFLMDTAPLPQAVLENTRDRIEKGRELSAFECAALLKAYACDPRPENRHAAELVLQAFLLQGLYFPFYRSLPKELIRKYLLSGLIVITHCSLSKQSLYVIAKTSRQTAGEPGGEQDFEGVMTETLPGYYTFVVRGLAGEELLWEILGEDGVSVSCGHEKVEPCAPELASSRYGRICALSGHRADNRELTELATLSDLTDTLFVPVKE